VPTAPCELPCLRGALPSYPLDATTWLQHAVAISLAHFGKTVRAGIDTAAELGDADTADVFTEISRAVDKQLWFVEAHLPADN